MKLVKLKNVNLPTIPDNEPPYATRPIPRQGGIPLHHLCGCIGGTGSGKTTKMLEFLLWYDKAGSFDRLIIFSPTLQREPKGKAFLKAEHNFEITYYAEYTDAIMIEERANMLADIAEWNMFQIQKSAWDKYKKTKDEKSLSMDELSALEQCGFEPPKWKYARELYPTFAMVLDDHVGKKGVFNANCRSKLVEICVEHRHLSLSIYILSQVFANFIPRQLRGGCINLWMLFSTKSDKHMEDIGDDVATKIPPDKFIQAWKFATEKSPHDCLVVDYKCNDINLMLRRNFDHVIQGIEFD